MIKSVIYWSNGTVMVFDTQGQQMPEFQGRFSECKQKILDVAGSDVEFKRGIWNRGWWPITRLQFEALEGK